jgi:membrane protease YdiL (CAAX protease family)
MSLFKVVKRHPLLAYFGLTFGITWAGTLLVVWPTGIPGRESVVAQLLPPVALAMLAGPSVASLVLTGAIERRTGLRALLTRFGHWRLGGWYAVALLAPALLAATLGTLALVSPAFVPGIVVASGKAGVVAFALVAGLAAGLVEEIGWTGFALPRLLRRYGTLTAGVLLGAIWAVWHLLADYWGTAIEYGDLWLPYFLEWIVALTAYRVLIAWVYSHTGSLLLAQLMHATFTGGQALLEPAAASATERLLWYGAFAVALWIVVAGVFVIQGRRVVPEHGLRTLRPRTV